MPAWLIAATRKRYLPGLVRLGIVRLSGLVEVETSGVWV